MFTLFYGCMVIIVSPLSRRDLQDHSSELE